jgi:hypothetical protein
MLNQKGCLVRGQKHVRRPLFKGRGLAGPEALPKSDGNFTWF